MLPPYHLKIQIEKVLPVTVPVLVDFRGPV